MKGYFCSDTFFNLSNKVLTEHEIKVLQKSLDFAPIQIKVNEPELRQDFENFYRRMRIKWHFWNEPLKWTTVVKDQLFGLKHRGNYHEVILILRCF